MEVEHRLADVEDDLGIGGLDRDGLGRVVQQAAGLGDGLARHDHALERVGALGGFRFGERQAVAVGGDGAQDAVAALSKCR